MYCGFSKFLLNLFWLWSVGFGLSLIDISSAIIGSGSCEITVFNKISDSGIVIPNLSSINFDAL